MTATCSGMFALLKESCVAIANKNLNVMNKSETYESKSILVVGVAVTSVLVARSIITLADVQTIENHALGLRAAL